MKRCPECGTSFPATTEYFHRRGAGLNTYCKPCAIRRAKDHYRANHEAGLAQRAEYRESHRDEIARWQRESRDKGAKRRYDREYRARNGDRLRDQARRRYRADVQSYVERALRWAAANPEKALAHTRAKNLRRRAGDFDADAREYSIVLRQDPCCYCGSRDVIEVDHITAVANDGDNQWLNLTAACRHCNAAKHSLSLLTFIRQRSAA